MGNVFKKFDLVIQWIEDIACALFLVGIIGISAVQVILRYGFGLGFLWADEVNQSLLVAMGMFGCAKAVRTKGHTELTLVVNKLKGSKARIAFRAVINVISLATLIILFVAAFQYTSDATTIKSVMLRIPRMYYYISMPIGIGLSIYEFLKLMKSRIMNDTAENY